MNNELKTISLFFLKAPHPRPVRSPYKSPRFTSNGASQAARAAKLKLKGIRGWSGGLGTNQELIVGYMIVGIVP